MEFIQSQSKGLSYAIDNEMLMSLTRPKKENGKELKITQIGRLFIIFIWYKMNGLNGYESYENIAYMLFIPVTKTDDGKIKNYNMLKTRVRKTLKELSPIIEYKEDVEKGIKFTHIPKGANLGMYMEKGETKGFTQLFCTLSRVVGYIKEGNPLDFLVVHTVLEYFNGSEKCIYPSLNTIAEKCGCSRRKIVTLLSEGEQFGLWKIKSTKGGSQKNTNRYILTNDQGKYLYLDILEKQLELQKKDLEVEELAQ